MSASDGLAVRVAEPLSRHTPMRTGGPCDVFVVVHREEALPGVISDCRQVGWRWWMLGAGTRVAFRDGPVQGAVIRLGTDFARIERIGDLTWRVGGAVPVPALLDRLAREGHSGLEALAGVAGSVGGSLLWDAAWKDVTEQVGTIARDKARDVPLDEVAGRRNRIVTGATITMMEDSPAKVRANLARRAARSRTGTWYEAPSKGDLREILRTAQLPLVRLRRVAIPDAAPELLINLGGGSASDLALLHRSATERVKKVRGIELAATVRWVGSALS